MQFGTLGYDGAFTWRLRHWFAVFKYPPDGNGSVKFGYLLMLSLPIFWRITQRDQADIMGRMKTQWCRPFWMFSLYRIDKVYRTAELRWLPLK